MLNIHSNSTNPDEISRPSMTFNFFGFSFLINGIWYCSTRFLFMKHDDAPESIMAQPKNGFIRRALFALGALRIGVVEKYIFKGDTFSIEYISISESVSFSSDTLLPVVFRGPHFPTRYQTEVLGQNRAWKDRHWRSVPCLHNCCI